MYSEHISHPRRDVDPSPRRILRGAEGSPGSMSFQVDSGDYRESTHQLHLSNEAVKRSLPLLELLYPSVLGRCTLSRMLPGK